jgi:hypothetical protein
LPAGAQFGIYTQWTVPLSGVACIFSYFRSQVVSGYRVSALDVKAWTFAAVQSKGSKNRHVMLPEEVLELATAMVEGAANALRCRCAAAGTPNFPVCNAGNPSATQAVSPPVDFTRYHLDCGELSR